MPRIHKKAPVRKNELLDVAQKLFYQKGYDNTTIEDVLNIAGVSKGALYYHFRSKEEILDSLMVRMSEKIRAEIEPIINDPSLGVLQKLKKTYSASWGIKKENISLSKIYLEVIFKDENIRLRHKLNTMARQVIVPVYQKLIQQGIAEGIFNPPSPEFAAAMICSMALGLTDVTWNLLTDFDQNPENAKLLSQSLSLFEDAVERLLGAPHGSLSIMKDFDLTDLQEKKHGDS